MMTLLLIAAWTLTLIYGPYPNIWGDFEEVDVEDYDYDLVTD